MSTVDRSVVQHDEYNIYSPDESVFLAAILGRPRRLPPAGSLLLNRHLSWKHDGAPLDECPMRLHSPLMHSSALLLVSESTGFTGHEALWYGNCVNV